MPSAALRIPPVEGALNFRDLGGYPTADGRALRWNRLYRSGSLHALTDADVHFLHSLGMRCVFDLRSTAERQRFPSRLADEGPIELWYREHDERHGDFFKILREPQAAPGDAQALMRRTYRQIPYAFRAAYRELFVRLARGNLPLVVHCTAGKDRTGIAAALVLSAAGVSRETIMEDYLITEEFFERNCTMMRQGIAEVLFAGIDDRIWEPLMRTDSSYLSAMFEELDDKHGSIEGYLRDVLQLDAGTREALRHHLLDTPSGLRG